MTEISMPLVDGYEVLELIAKGSMGSVWLARQVSMNRLVSLKVLHRDIISNKEMMQRFVREARVCATLDHPNLIRVHDVVRVGSGWALVMEYVPGATLSETQKKRGLFPEKEVRAILLQALEALGYLHSKGIAHRDVKPDNLMIMDSGLVKLADLGLARMVDVQKTLTAIDEILGTPAYMAPEQLHNAHAAGKLCDYYSLGATAWHMLAGRAPYEGPSAMDVLIALEKGPPPDLASLNMGVTTKMSHTVARLMSRDPSRRPQDLDDAKKLVTEGPPLALKKIVVTIVLALLLLVGFILNLENATLPENGNPTAEATIHTQDNPPMAITASEAAREMLAKALEIDDPHERILLLEAILREYPGSDVALECSQPLEIAMELWSREQQRLVEQASQEVNTAIKARRFTEAKSWLESLRSFDMSAPWVRDHLPSILKESTQAFTGAKEACLEEALESAKRQADKGLLRESLSILRAAQSHLEREPRLEVRLHETEYLITLETKKLNAQIGDFILSDLKRICRQRRFNDILAKVDDMAFHPLADTQSKTIEDLRTLAFELAEQEKQVERIYEQRLGQKIQMPGQGGLLQGTVVKHNQAICLKLSEKRILPILEAADPRHIAQVTLEAVTTAHEVLRASLYARFVAQDDGLASKLSEQYITLAGEHARNLSFE